MKVTIPFPYEVVVVPPRCRKERSQYVRDTVEIEIQEVDQLPLAATWTEEHAETGQEVPRWVHHAKGGFWEPLLLNPAAGLRAQHITADLFRRQVENPKVTSGRFRVGSIYHRDKSDLPTQQGLEQAGFRVQGSNRHVLVQDLERMATEYLVFDEKVYAKTGEPGYQIMTFGAIGKRGKSVWIPVVRMDAIGVKSRNIFPVTAVREASFCAEHAARQNGSPRDVSVRPEREVTVHMPEVFSPLNDAVKQRLAELGWKEARSPDVLTDTLPADVLAALEKVAPAATGDAHQGLNLNW